MPFRMADYCLRIYRRFPNKRLYQVVVYLHKTDSDLVKQTTFNIGEMSHRFHVIRMWEQPTEIFLQTPGLLPLAVLSNTPDQTNTLREVATLIGNVEEKQMQSNLAVTTFVLAGLVLEEEVIQHLLRRDIMRESVTYQLLVREGREEGLEEGLELGRKEGRKEGLEVGLELAAVNLLRQGMSLALINQVTGLTIVKLRQLQKSQITEQDTPDQSNPSL